jgi:hypothetical protein
LERRLTKLLALHYLEDSLEFILKLYPLNEGTQISELQALRMLIESFIYQQCEELEPVFLKLFEAFLMLKDANSVLLFLFLMLYEVPSHTIPHYVLRDLYRKDTRLL